MNPTLDRGLDFSLELDLNPFGMDANPLDFDLDLAIDLATTPSSSLGLRISTSIATSTQISVPEPPQLLACGHAAHDELSESGACGTGAGWGPKAHHKPLSLQVHAIAVAPNG